MKAKKSKENKLRKLIGFLMCCTFILVILKLLFLPFYSTAQRAFDKYEKHSPVGSSCTVNLAYIEPVDELNQGINSDENKNHTYYYYGFDEDYNVSLIAIKDKYHLAMEKELSDKENSNKKYHGVIIDSSGIKTYNNDQVFGNSYGSENDGFFGNNTSGNEFSSGYNSDNYNTSNVLDEYSILQIDLNSTGTEEVRTGLGAGAYALILAAILFSVAMALIFISGKETDEEDEDDDDDNENSNIKQDFAYLLWD